MSSQLNYMKGIVAERLRRSPRKRLGFPRAGSNPADVVFDFFHSPESTIFTFHSSKKISTKTDSVIIYHKTLWLSGQRRAVASRLGFPHVGSNPAGVDFLIFFKTFITNSPYPSVFLSDKFHKMIPTIPNSFTKIFNFVKFLPKISSGLEIE
jgi:hypothetical protein